MSKAVAGPPVQQPVMLLVLMLQLLMLLVVYVELLLEAGMCLVVTVLPHDIWDLLHD